VADEHRLTQVQMTGDGGDVSSESVQVVATAGHVRPAMAATVEGDTAEPGVHEIGDLAIPHILAGPESVYQENGAAIGLSPVGEMKPGPVSGGGKWHGRGSFASGRNAVLPGSARPCAMSNTWQVVVARHALR
jgi:hypothetical protein